MNISIHFEIINLDIQFDYVFKLHNYYIAFSQNHISFIDNNLKLVMCTCYFVFLGKPYISPYNDKLIIQYLNGLHSVYDIFNLDGKKLTNTPINCKSNYIILYNNVLCSLSLINNGIYIYDHNDVIKCVIKLDVEINWFSNPIIYNHNDTQHIVILLRNSNNLYLIIDINNNITHISNEFIIDHNITDDKITIGYNNGLEIYICSVENIILGKIEDINYIKSINNQLINGGFIDVQLIKKFKRSDIFSQILDDLKGNIKAQVYSININNWETSYPPRETFNIYKSIINKTLNNDGIVEPTEPSLELECVSTNYMDFIKFIIDNYNTDFINMYLYNSKYYNIIYSNILSETYVLEIFTEKVDLTTYSKLFDNYFFTTYSLSLSDNSLTKRYFPLYLYKKTILEKGEYFYYIPNKFTTFSLIDKIIQFFTKIDIINIKLDFSLLPFYKISKNHIHSIGIDYFTNLWSEMNKDYIRLDIDIQSNLNVILNTILNPTFNSNSLETYIAVGLGTNTIAYSTNGITWTGLGASIFSVSGYGVSYSAKLNTWVAVGEGTNTIAYSTDGINWIGLGKSILSVSGRGVAYSSQLNRWIAVGEETNTIAYSTDSITWTGLGKSILSVSGRGVAYSSELNRWIAVGQGTNTIAYSTDGITWMGLGKSIFSVSGYGVSYSTQLNRWIAVGEGTNTIAYSTDGINWTGLGKSIFSDSGYGVAYSGALSQWVAVGQGTNTIAYSTNGIDWTGLSESIFSVNGRNVTYSYQLNRWVAVGQGTNTIAYSTDGVIWMGIGPSIFSDVGYAVDVFSKYNL